MHTYIHFPFCTGRCHYCAFTSGACPTPPERYVDALLREVEARSCLLEPWESLYCGGGTPALLGAKGFQRLAEEGFCQLQPQAEWTVELHPASVNEPLLETLRALGVTRLSLGVQSFDDATLVRCNRRHTAQQVYDAVALARQYIVDTGIDLIAGLPGVTDALWQETLRQAVALDLPHLSVYALSIDEGSTWFRQQQPPPDADAVCNAIALAEETLADHGLWRYETSNYARKGWECQHNLNTWNGGDYLGLGRGAVSRLGQRRRYGDGSEETLSPLEDALERVLTQLRTQQGGHLNDWIARFPLLAPYQSAWDAILSQARAHHLLTDRNTPTTRGYEVLDALERELLQVCFAH